MTRSRSWDNEAEGAALVSTLMAGQRTMRRDVGGAQNTHDFDIELADGSIVALEITQEVAPAVLAQRAYEAKQDWDFGELGFHWHVGVREPCDLRTLRSRIIGVLVRFQDEGRDRWLGGRHECDDDTAALLDSLGVRLIYRLGASSPGSVVIGTAPRAGMTAPDLLVSVVDDHTNRSDNRSKLSRAETAAERHVLIWIHADRSNLTAAMDLDVLPTRTPSLPGEVDVVWVASAYEQPRVWRVDRAGWTDQTSKARSGRAPDP